MFMDKARRSQRKILLYLSGFFLSSRLYTKKSPKFSGFLDHITTRIIKHTAQRQLLTAKVTILFF